ncbi:MAG: methyltransferase domain-containing protein [Acetatifactor sp.]|nr:methyltransferase domain-containing protein [Acetatifactor sp.]
MNKKINLENYREFFNKDYLMGPNSLRLLEEMLRKYPLTAGSRVMDLGCGRGITSLFLTKEAGVTVFATDLWISATENARSFEAWGVSDMVIPIHADANDLPYAEEYFDAIVSIDAFHYFVTCREDFKKMVLPYLKKGSVAIIAIPGLKKELSGKAAETLREWVGGCQRDYDSFKTRQQWLGILGQDEGYEVVMDFDLDCFEEAWEDWFESGHEYGNKDKEFLARGMDEYLSFVGLVIRRK